MEEIDIEAPDDMQSPATRKRVKRLLRLLKSQQHWDTNLNTATVMSFKYLLPYSSLITRCRVDFKKDDVTGRKEEAYVRYTKPRGEHARFIISQLEAWKITDPNDPDTVVIPLALDIFLECVVYDFEGEKAWPTVITWPCPIRHRTLYFFAFLNFNMPSNHYTIHELLALRKNGERARERLLRKYDDESLVSEMFMLEGIREVRAMMKEVMPNWSPPGTRDGADDKPAMPMRDDSSTSSEEVLFKGTARRRQQATSRDTIASRQAEPKGETVWKYSGRVESDPSATEPLSAPTGLPAQKSEGFQRFYKAVVSPTHVRVTAGGRIVPNTRGPPLSPTLKRPQEGSVAGFSASNDKVPGNAAPGAPVSMPMGAAMAAQMAPVMPPFFPGFTHPGFQPYGPQMPFYPMPFGHPMAGGYPPFPYPMPILRQPSADSALKDTLNLKTGDGQVDMGDDSQKSNKIGTAHQPQFDQRRPFFINGQWMYPLPGPFPAPVGGMGGSFMPMPLPMPMPMAMARGPGVPPVPPTNQPTQLGSPIKLSGPTGAGTGATGQQVRAFTAPTFAPPANSAANSYQPPPAPPISSIRPSEITRKQIGIFRKSLKYHEDQLQYNRHQIDEKDTEQKIQKYRDDIARFECMMQVQIEDEKNRGYPPLSEKDKSSEDSSGSEKKTSTSSGEMLTNDISAQQPAPPTLGPTVNNIAKAPVQDSRTTSRSPSGQSSNDPLKKPSLPTGAALAPPFEPRHGTSSEAAPTSRTAPFWTVSGYPAQGADGLYGNFLAGTQPWGPSVSRPDPAMFARSAGQTFVSNGTSVTSRGYLGVPYLIGSLPRGVNPRTAKDIDYQYSRELTEDELRARHLYWGKVPRSAVRGLPKYDGKNFYPPSPVKEDSKDAPALQTGADHMSFAPHSTDIDVVKFTPNPEGQPARPSTPVGSALVPCDSFEYAQEQNGDGIFKVTETSQMAGKLTVRGKPEVAEAGLDAESVISHDRRSEKPGGARLWEAMLKKGSSAALSSTTAEGKLQAQFAGSAAASLSPTLNRTSDSPASPGKESVDDSEGGALLMPAPERRGKNRALSGEASLE